ncbi:hypothetical protein PORY_002327 [Pneumocystis oryctolagi]|uniref:Uncharacterized protein n=1 Tax=Pneumocystis oryctolagi TaxID=42067 RepID=A0ACB7C9H5_9ASCO|nr:hypothetical protein PORY_002327 [Pneumocystis oryctolagi]
MLYFYFIYLFFFAGITPEGKIQRLRSECPHPTCGAGIFMALHMDRKHCGRCGLTMFSLKLESKILFCESCFLSGPFIISLLTKNTLKILYWELIQWCVAI